jgi:hypothetical protein
VFQQYKMRNAHFVLNEQSSESLKHSSHYGIEKFPFAHIWMDKQSFVVLRKSTTHCVNTRVTSKPKRRHDRQQMNREMTDKLPTLRKIKRAASQHTSQRFAAHLILPNRTQAHPPP